MERYCAKLQLPYGSLLYRTAATTLFAAVCLAVAEPFPCVAPLALKTEKTAKKVREKQPSQKSADLLAVDRYLLRVISLSTCVLRLVPKIQEIGTTPKNGS